MPFSLLQTPQVTPSGVFLAISQSKSPLSAFQINERWWRSNSAIEIIVSRIPRRTSARFESSLCRQKRSARSRTTSLAGSFGLKVRFSSVFTEPLLKCSFTHHSEIGFSPNSDFSASSAPGFLAVNILIEPVSSGEEASSSVVYSPWLCVFSRIAAI